MPDPSFLPTFPPPALPPALPPGSPSAGARALRLMPLPSMPASPDSRSFASVCQSERREQGLQLQHVCLPVLLRHSEAHLLAHELLVLELVGEVAVGHRDELRVFGHRPERLDAGLAQQSRVCGRLWSTPTVFSSQDRAIIPIDERRATTSDPSSHAGSRTSRKKAARINYLVIGLASSKRRGGVGSGQAA